MSNLQEGSFGVPSNREIDVKKTPLSFRKSLKATEAVFRRNFREDLKGVHLAPHERIGRQYLDNFIQNYSAVDMAVEQGVGVDLFASSSGLAFADESKSPPGIIVAEEAIISLGAFNEGKVEDREEISWRTAGIFLLTSEAYLRATSREVNLDVDDVVIEHFGGQMLGFMRENAKGREDESSVIEYLADLKELLAENRENITLSVRGVELRLNINNNPVLPIATKRGQAISTSVVNKLFGEYSQRMSKEFWFKLPEDYVIGRGDDSREADFVESIYKELSSVTDLPGVIEAFQSGQMGEIMCRSIEKELLIKKYDDLATIEDVIEAEEDNLGENSGWSVGDNVEMTPEAAYLVDEFEKGRKPSERKSKKPQKFRER